MKIGVQISGENMSMEELLKLKARCPNCERVLKQDKNDPDKLICTKKCGYEWIVA